MALVVFETVNTNRRILVNFDQVCKVTAGGSTSVILYSDGSQDVVRATFTEVCQAVDVESTASPYVDSKVGE